MNRIFDVIVVGELNPDLIMNQVESFPETGKEKLAGTMTLTLGSSSAIFASNLSSIGSKVAFIGKIGNDVFGRFCRERLNEKGVNTAGIQVDNQLDTGATVVLNFGEDRAMITHQGAMKYFGLHDIKKEKLLTAGHLHFSSYFLQPGFINDLDALFKIAKDAGMTTSLDAQWDPREKWEFDYKKIIPFVDVFLPNERELQQLTGQPTTELAIEEIRDIVNILVIKMGNRGSLLVHKTERLFKPAFLNRNVVDAIGAGDSFNAGFISKFIKNQPLDVCLEFGNLMAAVSTTASGGTTAFTDMHSIMKIAKEKFGYEPQCNPA